ncbi:hypothetical protein DFQ26_000973 [Actinomortierella ambigua]|nr:hypothetical protein DFQ26_000973 [Actinomortierella ambigua]
MGNTTSQSEQTATIDGLRLGPPPHSWDSNIEYKIHADITDPINQRIEPVGRSYLAHARRTLHKRTFSEDEAIFTAQQEEAARVAAQREDAASALDDSQFEIEPDHPSDLKRDARDWKAQDHYRILGLGKLRWRATRAMIKKAHRTKVLVHHPDKKSSENANAAESAAKKKQQQKKAKDEDDDNYFKCIQRAYEILMDPVKRRQYDSVDPIPEDAYSPLKDGADRPFIEAWAPVFEREARFSVRDPKTVPMIGTMASTREEVLAFYQFWFHFESWRSFEYLDKEEEDLSENRDEKRYMEKKNKAERAKRKREEAVRLQKLVDTAYNLDPRLVAFKEQDRLTKEAKKQEKQEVAKRARLEAEKEAALARERQEELEAEERTKREEERKEREAKKKVMRNKKKVIKAAIKDENYFLEDGKHMPVAKLDIYVSELDSMLDKLSLETLEELATKLQDKTSKLSRPAKKALLEDEAKRLVRDSIADATSLSQFGVESVKPLVKPPSSSSSVPSSETGASSSSSSLPSYSTSKNRPEWSTDEIQLLIKAANKFPGGVQDRWDTIAGYIAYHTGLPQRSAEEVIKKSQQVQNKAAQAATVRQLQFQRKAHIEIADAPSVRYDVLDDDDHDNHNNDNGVQKNKKGGGAGGKSRANWAAKSDTTPPAAAAASKTAKSPTTSNALSSASLGAPTTTATTSTTSTTSTAGAAAVPPAASWTAGEQKQLEAALKTYPPSWQGEGDRWDKIAEAVQGRTKKECKLRVKFLQEQVKAQRAAAAANKA